MKQIILSLSLVLFCLGADACTIKPESASGKEFFIGVWTPLSRAFMSGGDMTVDKSTIQWTDGEKLEYKIISKINDNEYVLQVIGTSQHDKGRGYEFIGLKLAPDIWFPDDKTKYSLEVTFADKIADVKERKGSWGVYLPKESPGSH